MKNLNDVQHFMSTFEQGLWPHDQWKHRHHLLVALWYLNNFPFPKALEKVKQGIHRHNDAHDVKQTLTSGYHETMTVFLMQLLSQERLKLKPLPTVLEQLKVMEEKFGDFRKTLLEYYSPEVIDSWEARKNWVKPNLKDFKF